MFVDYDPWQDAQRNWSAWTIRTADLHGLGETCDMQQKIFVTDPVAAGELRAMTHAIAHLELGHHLTPGGVFTDEQEAEAELLTDIRVFTDVGDLIESVRDD